MRREVRNPLGVSDSFSFPFSHPWIMLRSALGQLRCGCSRFAVTLEIVRPLLTSYANSAKRASFLMRREVRNPLGVSDLFSNHYPFQFFP